MCDCWRKRLDMARRAQAGSCTLNHMRGSSAVKDINLDPKALLGLRLIDDNASTISSKIGKIEPPAISSKVGKVIPQA